MLKSVVAGDRPARFSNHDHPHVLVSKGHAHTLGRMRSTIVRAPGRRGTFSVRLNQPTHAKFDASKVADDREHDVGQVVRPNHPQDGRPCTVAWFAIVAGPEVVAIEPNHPCEGDVPSGVVGFSDGLEMTFDLRFRVDGKAVPEVLAALGFEQPFARPFQRG